jgi:hypothetical protein
MTIIGTDEPMTRARTTVPFSRCQPWQCGPFYLHACSPLHFSLVTRCNLDLIWEDARLLNLDIYEE